MLRRPAASKFSFHLLDDALAIMQAAVRHHRWDGLAPGLSVTVTIGVADGGEEPEDLLRRADAALYEGKRAGRDTVTR